MNKSKQPVRNYNEEYSPEVQQVFLNCMISDPDTFARLRSIISEDYFHDTLRPAVRFVLDYADEFRTVPAVEQVRARTGVVVEKFSEGSHHQPWFLQAVEEFCRYKALENAILEGVDLLQKGEGAEIERRVKAAMTISLMSDLGCDYFDDPKTRLERLRDHSSYISTGWNTLDDKLYGGFTRGALNIFAGGSGSGKSLFLQNIALNWVYAGLHVIYFTLELSEDLVALRLDAMVAGKSTTEVMRGLDDTALKVALKGKKSGKLTLKKLPEGGTNTNTLRAFLKEYEIKTGIKPDAIVVDYLDLLYPNNNRIDPSDLFVKDKFTSEELRGLAHEANCLCVTASQLNRQSIEAMGELDHSHIAGGISKINTADNVFGIYTTAAMKEKGLYYLQFLKTRSAASVGQRIELGYDPICMRITDPVMAMSNPFQPLAKQDLRRELAAATRAPPPTSASINESASPKVMDLMSRLKVQTTKGEH